MEPIDDIRDASELADWELGSELGRGAIGTVYLATERATGKKCAIKLMRPGTEPDEVADARVRREIANCLALRHAHVVGAYAGGRAGATYFLVMELCQGGNLERIVAHSGPLEASGAVRVARHVLGGLEYAHSAPIPGRSGLRTVHGLVHRDLKPQNILFAGAPGWQAKVGDFGLAKAFELAGLSGLTRTGSAAGTPAFMPRQQILNYKYASPPVDVWAAAASLYFALSGHSPRDFPPGRDPWRVVWDTPPVPLAQRGVPVPPALAAVIDGALDDAGDDLRYLTAADLRRAIEAARRDDKVELW